jgi:hypothetical protein
MTGYVLLYVQAADYHDAVCHGPFESAEAARAYRELTWPSYELDEGTLGEEWWASDEDDCVILVPLVKAVRA